MPFYFAIWRTFSIFRLNSQLDLLHSLLRFFTFRVSALMHSENPPLASIVLVMTLIVSLNRSEDFAVSVYYFAGLREGSCGGISSLHLVVCFHEGCPAFSPALTVRILVS